MAGWRLLFDIDSTNQRLAAHLVARNWDCSSAVAHGWDEMNDDDLLAAAASEGRVVYTANKVDFARLAAQWSREGRFHAGIIIRVPQWASAEQQLGALERLANTFEADISNQLLWSVAR